MKKKYLKFPIIVLVVLYAIVSLFAITVSAEGEYSADGTVKIHSCFNPECQSREHNGYYGRFVFSDESMTNLLYVEVSCGSYTIQTNATSNIGLGSLNNVQLNEHWGDVFTPDPSSSDPISSSEVPSSSSSIPESSSSEPVSSSDSSSSKSTSDSGTSESESSSSEVVSSSDSETSSSESESEISSDYSSEVSSSESVSNSDTSSGIESGTESSSSSSVASDPVESEPVRSESIVESSSVASESVIPDPVIEEITVTEPITTYTVTPSAYGYSNPNALLPDFIIPQTTAQSNGNIDENELVIIPDEDVPMAEPIIVNIDSWSLFNLIISIVVILVALYNVLKLLFQFKKKKEFDDEASEYYEISNLKRNIVLRIVKIALGILTPLFFILTENIWSKMVLFNLNSIVYFIIAVVVCVFWFLCGKNKEELVEAG